MWIFPPSVPPSPPGARTCKFASSQSPFPGAVAKQILQQPQLKSVLRPGEIHLRRKRGRILFHPLLRISFAKQISPLRQQGFLSGVGIYPFIFSNSVIRTHRAAEKTDFTAALTFLPIVKRELPKIKGSSPHFSPKASAGTQRNPPHPCPASLPLHRGTDPARWKYPYPPGRP